MEGTTLVTINRVSSNQGEGEQVDTFAHIRMEVNYSKLLALDDMLVEQSFVCLSEVFQLRSRGSEGPTANGWRNAKQRPCCWLC